MNTRDTTYRKMFDAWNAGEHALALELSRESLQEFPDFNIGWDTERHWRALRKRLR